MRLFNGDCLELLRGLETDSIDLIATDPPYGYSFMGKAWDTFEPKGAYQNKKGLKQLPGNQPFAMTEFFVPIWQECLRALKPGAFAFVMCAPRQDVLCKQILALQEAGFNTGFSSLYFCFASGFPKAMSVSKALDKRLGAKREIVREYETHDIRNAGLMDKKGSMIVKETIPATPQAKALDGSYGGAQFKPAVEVILVCMKPLSRITRSDFAGEYDYFYTSRIDIKDKTEADRKQKAKLEQKYNIILKAGDVVESRIALNPRFNDETLLNRDKVLKSKPYTNSDLSGYVSEALKNRKGISWLDDCKVPYESEWDKGQATPQGECTSKEISAIGAEPDAGRDMERVGFARPEQIGRFPANIICSDDVLNDGKNYKKGGSIRSAGQRNNQVYGEDKSLRGDWDSYGDSGSFSRYFDLDKWFDGLLGKLKSKAYNNEKNIGDTLWEISQAEDDLGLKDNPILANGVVSNSPIMPAIEPTNTISAQQDVMPSSDLASLNPDARFAEERLDYTATDFVQRLAQIKQDTETLLRILTNETLTHTMQNEPSLISQSVASYVISKLTDLRDIIQTAIDQPRLFGSVIPVIIEQTQQDLSQDQLWQNFWQERIKLLPESQQRTFPFAVICKASKSEKNRGCGDLPLGEPPASARSKPAEGRQSPLGKPRSNSHPTVKPLKLMSYLITLGSREGDVVLDPFMGSGTTGVACQILGRNFIGAEIGSGYFAIAEARINSTVQKVML